MNINNTFERFKLISGLDGGDALSWESFISDAREYIETLVTKEDLFESDEKRLDNAAAVYAYYRYVCYTLNEESSFSAGDLRVNYNNDKMKAAKEMWDSELESIRDIADVEKSIFVFKRVK